MVKFVDKATINGVKMTSEGYLIADVFAVRTGIQHYAGYEVGRPDLPVVNVYRDESEVFSPETLQSFSHVPVTNDHPSEAVTSDNWKDLAVGEASTEVLRDGGRMKIPLVLKDQAAIADVRAGKRELSAGYACDLVWEDGVAADGTRYQAKQTNIRANHIAIVSRGRAGHDFRIGDGAANWGAAPITDEETPMNLRSIVVDGITIQVTDQGADAIVKLQGQLTDLQTQLTNSASTHATAIAAKDTEIGELKIKLADAEKAKPTAQQLDAMATERAQVIDAAKSLKSDIATDGKTLGEIRKEAVASKFGDEMVKDASEDMISGMFAAATKDAKTTGVDPVRNAVLNRDTSANVNDNGQDVYEARIRDAWKGEAAAK